MPRVYQKKSGTCGARPYRSKYTDQQMEAAIKAVESGKSVRAASKQFGVPSSTLHDKIRGKDIKRKLTRVVIFTKFEGVKFL